MIEICWGESNTCIFVYMHTAPCFNVSVCHCAWAIANESCRVCAYPHGTTSDKSIANVFHFVIK